MLGFDYLQLIFHGNDRKSLHQYISPKCLPACYGGNLQLPRITGPQWLELLLLCDKEYDGTTNPLDPLLQFQIKALKKSKRKKLFVIAGY